MKLSRSYRCYVFVITVAYASEYGLSDESKLANDKEHGIRERVAMNDKQDNDGLRPNEILTRVPID